MSIYKFQTFNTWYMYIFMDIREEFAFKNLPTTRQSNPLNANSESDVDPMILTKLFTYCMSLRLLLGDSSSFYV